MRLTKNQKIVVLGIIVAVVAAIFAAISIVFGALSLWGNFREDLGYIKGTMDYSEESNIRLNNKGLDNNYEYESYFDDNDWKVNGWWQKDEKTLICEPNPITERDGGPKMTNTNHFASDNFSIDVEFTPKSNSDEINFVISIEDSYRIVLGDGNRKFFYIKQGDNFTAETNKDFKGPIELENEIRFNEPVKIEIIQSVPNNTNIMNVSVTILYFPEENRNTKPFPETYHFQMDNNSFCDNKREITLGLLCEKNTVAAKFNYFYLKNN